MRLLIVCWCMAALIIAYYGSPVGQGGHSVINKGNRLDRMPTPKFPARVMLASCISFCDYP